MNSKQCTQCGETKPIMDFPKRSMRDGGKARPKCKVCYGSHQRKMQTERRSKDNGYSKSANGRMRHSPKRIVGRCINCFEFTVIDLDYQACGVCLKDIPGRGLQDGEDEIMEAGARLYPVRV